MKLVITSLGEELDSPVDQRFGRARYFIVFDTETGEWEPRGNRQNLQAVQGAGIQAAQTASELGAEAVITGHCGPKAFRTLTAAGIAVYQGAEGTVQKAVDAWKAEKLTRADGADVDSGYGSV